MSKKASSDYLDDIAYQRALRKKAEDDQRFIQQETAARIAQIDTSGLSKSEIEYIQDQILNDVIKEQTDREAKGVGKTLLNILKGYLIFIFKLSALLAVLLVVLIVVPVPEDLAPVIMLGSMGLFIFFQYRKKKPEFERAKKLQEIQNRLYPKTPPTVETTKYTVSDADSYHTATKTTTTYDDGSKKVNVDIW